MDQPIIEYFSGQLGKDALARLDQTRRDVLEQINQKVAACESLAAIMDFVFQSTWDISSTDRLGLAFAEEESRRIVAHYSKASYEPLILKTGFHRDLENSSLKQVIQEGKVRIIYDLEAYLAEHPESVATRLLVHEGVRSNMTCPLTVDGRRVGVLFRSSRKVRDFDADEVAMHLLIAERLSQAVEKAYQIEQLTAANRAYMEMLGFVAHELKSPLASLIMDGKLLTDGYVGDLEPPQSERVQKMVGKAEYLLNLIRDYLDLARIEGGSLELHAQKEVDLKKAVLDRASDMLAEQLQESQARLEVSFEPDPLLLQADPDLLLIVLINLMGNGIKYGNKGGLLEVRAVREAAEVVVTVRNQGPGFPEELKGRLFRKFSRLSTPELAKRKGTGVGLYTVWRIIKLHGGSIAASSKEGEWAEFTFTLPQPRSEAL